jgi:hypothetical protein
MYHTPRFLPGQRVRFVSLVNSAKTFHGSIIEAIGDGFYYWVNDGTGTPRPVRADRLKGGATHPPPQEVA